MYMAKPVQVDQYNKDTCFARSDSDKYASPIPPPPLLVQSQVPQTMGMRTEAAKKEAKIRPVAFDRDKLLDEVRNGVQLRHTVTNDKSAPVGVGRVCSGGYSPPLDSVTSLSEQNSQVKAKKPIFFEQHLRQSKKLPVTAPPLPSKIAAPVALLKLDSSSSAFDHEKLLNEIQGGIHLRKTVTNDRSAPIGVGTVRDDIIPKQSINENTSASSTKHLESTTTAPIVPVQSLSPPTSSQLSKSIKPVTNPALLKLGGKQPIDRDALLASIRSGVRLRKVEVNDHSSPFSTSPCPSSELQARKEQMTELLPPPPPPLFALPPQTLPSLDPVSRSRPPKKAFVKLGGKVTVSRDELLRSIRQGVKLRKTVNNDKCSVIINDDDSGVKCSGRSSPTSNYEDDVYGSQSLSDLSSIGTSRLSPLSNIPPERPCNFYLASPTPAVAEPTSRSSTLSHCSQSTSSFAKASTFNHPSLSVNFDMVNCERETHHKEKEQKEKKIQIRECYRPPASSREQIESEIPVGSTRDRIRMFGQTMREASSSPTRSISKKTDFESDSGKASVLHMKKLLKDTTVANQSSDVSGSNDELENILNTTRDENSIQKMVRMFSVDENSTKASQPPRYQRNKNMFTEPEKIVPSVKKKPSSNKGALKKSSTKEPKMRRKLSVKIDSSPSKLTTSEELPLELSRKTDESHVDQLLDMSQCKISKVDISKFKKKFESFPEKTESTIYHISTSQENPKPGRIKKPSWITDKKSDCSSSRHDSCKLEKSILPSSKEVKGSGLSSEFLKREETKKTSFEESFHQQCSSHEKSPEAEEFSVSFLSSDATSAQQKPAVLLKDEDEIPPVPLSSPPEIPHQHTTNVPVMNDERLVKEAVASTCYAKKAIASTKRPLTRKSSNFKKNSTLNTGGLFNSLSKPICTNFSTTGETTTIGVNEEPKYNFTNRSFVFKPKIQSKVSNRQSEESLDIKTTSLSTKKPVEKIDGVYYANIGIAIEGIYALPGNNTSWYRLADHINSCASSSTSSSLSSLSSSTSYLKTTNNDKYANIYGNLNQQDNKFSSPVISSQKSTDNHYVLHQQPCNRRIWGPLVSRGHQVIVGESLSRATIQSSFERQSFVANDLNKSQEELKPQRKDNFFSRNYRFEINVDNDEEPLRIVRR
ncbi:unnamed protein product [Thelazia callipaeda]|uniref:WH2 domain-containing protein n=1 Tax=Thelazia callipaeda TaxID=103827 RepID=A0A0N5D9K5_THECL|nr:unnamed protein product [Thelazia callipaeda]